MLLKTILTAAASVALKVAIPAAIVSQISTHAGTPRAADLSRALTGEATMCGFGIDLIFKVAIFIIVVLVILTAAGRVWICGPSTSQPRPIGILYKS